MPKANVTPLVSNNPSAINQRGLLRSDTEPIMNLEIPYATESPVIAQPSCTLVNSGCALRIAGSASEKLFRTR